MLDIWHLGALWKAAEWGVAELSHSIARVCVKLYPLVRTGSPAVDTKDAILE